MIFLKRAWADTHRLIGGWPTFIAIIILPLMGLSFHYYVDGFVPMVSEAHIWLLYMLAPLWAAFLMLFSWNLVWAPYRIEKDAHLETKAQLDKFSSQNSFEKPRRLTAPQIKSLAGAFRSSGAKRTDIDLLRFQASDESSRFMLDICDAIDVAGLKPVFPELIMQD